MAPGTGSCKTLGETCALGAECCSTNCQGGHCVAAYSCQAYGDICSANVDCCSAVCEKPAGSAVGRCQQTGGSGGTSNCNQDGVPCPSGPTNCCTNVCLDLGSGVPVCAVASGCRVTGDTCSATSQCCGAPGNGENFSVTCENAPSGRCDNGNACNGVGTICGKAYSTTPPYVIIFQVNTNNNCCAGKDACHLDSAGIPRCFGGCSTQSCTGPGDCPHGYTGEPGCCIPAGEQCQFGDQCCDDNPCVPDGSGVLRCTAPTCTPLGSPCTATSTCCEGTCRLLEGIGPVCALPPPGTCTANGQGCSSGSQCCSNYCSGTPATCQTPPACTANGQGCTSGSQCCTGYCDNNTCGPPPTCAPSGGSCTTTPCCAGLTCTGTPLTCQTACLANGNPCTSGSQCCSTVCTAGLCAEPQACQPQGGTCTATADCCTGFSCVIPVGQSSGTCQTGPTCPSAGQQCSQTTPCCPGLLCTDQGTYTPCTGTTTCVCVFQG
ncbi:MAG TPA: hypothetical protein VFR85_06885 [Anaeromyxobacteraceae bacterium]|nr:hypothetical protein [Anaeromyxobacteraceae bacterium]